MGVWAIVLLFFVQGVHAQLPDGVRFHVTTQDYQRFYKPSDDGVDPGGWSYGTRMYAEYQTPSVLNLENYAVVQFIRGCQFNTQFVNGKVIYRDNILIDTFDQRQRYDFPVWVTDSIDTDPMYNNTPIEDFASWKTRHGLYRWNTVSGSFDEKSELLYYEKKPTVPRLYVVDHPGTAFFIRDTAKNISLQFQTCLYNTDEIPLVATPLTMDPKKALSCTQWGSSFIYNFKTGVFDHPQGIHPHCFEK